ncbi:type II toxin-antitoxin system VapC family toxin [Mesorhizobium sp. CAU 1732]|uniref:type II toxin-antitoxin system VapC family toxin n=1 Tax=Mesorhizobium sp. CAU 1732 TaxID=3140358 RepID=UPI0032619F5F
MKRYLLDTNIISDMVRNPAGQAMQRLQIVGDENVCTSIIVASELRYGCAKKGSAKLQERVEEVLAVIPVLPLEAAADIKYGAIRAELERMGKPIGHNDLLIAAHACVLSTTLVTANVGEFNRIDTLDVENWLV